MATLRYRYRDKKSRSDGAWEQASSDQRYKEKQDWCEFYTPLGRMVTKPSGKKPGYMGYDEWCAAKTPFKNQIISNPKRKYD